MWKHLINPTPPHLGSLCRVGINLQMLSWADEAIPTINAKLELEPGPWRLCSNPKRSRLCSGPVQLWTQLALTFTQHDPPASLSWCAEQEDHREDQEKEGGSRTWESAADLSWGLSGPLIRVRLGGKVQFCHC